MKLIEPTDLPEYGVRLGFTFIQGEGFMIGVETAEDVYGRKLTAQQARELADIYGRTREAEALKPVIDALRAKAKRLEDWLFGDALKDVTPEGNA